jgi:hypothetical protein
MKSFTATILLPNAHKDHNGWRDKVSHLLVQNVMANGVIVAPRYFEHLSHYVTEYKELGSVRVEQWPVA